MSKEQVTDSKGRGRKPGKAATTEEMYKRNIQVPARLEENLKTFVELCGARSLNALLLAVATEPEFYAQKIAADVGMTLAKIEKQRKEEREIAKMQQMPDEQLMAMVKLAKARGLQ